MGGAASQYWQQSQGNKFLNILAGPGCGLRLGVCFVSWQWSHNSLLHYFVFLAVKINIRHTTPLVVGPQGSPVSRVTCNTRLSWRSVQVMCHRVTNVSRFLLRDLLSCDILTSQDTPPWDSLDHDVSIYRVAIKEWPKVWLYCDCILDPGDYSSLLGAHLMWSIW